MSLFSVFVNIRYDGEVLTEGLQVLLSFNLARGNVGALLRTIKLLQGIEVLQPFKKFFDF